MAFAEESTERGLTLIPKDPFVAVDMRLAMKDFDDIFSYFWEVYSSRHEDVEKLEAFKTHGLAKYEEICKKAGDKWLLGTEEPTLLDIHHGAMWDLIYARHTGDVYKLSREIQ